jgi:hypothetical protein
MLASGSGTAGLLIGGAVRWIRVWGPVLVIVAVIAVAAPRKHDGTDRSLRHQTRMAGATQGQPKRGRAQSPSPQRLVQERILMEKLLGHHVILATRMMRAQVRGAPDLVHILRDAISTNTSDVVAAVRSVHGARAATSFRGLWTDHNVAFIEYAEAIANNDQNAEKAAKGDLDGYRKSFGKFAQSVTNSKLKARSVARSLSTHIDQLLEQIEAYAAGKYTIAYRLQRSAYAHMFPTGHALTERSSSQHPGELPLRLTEPAQKLRSALGLLLGEHVELLVDTTRAAVRGSPEFEEAASALNENTRDLTEAFSGLVGNRSARTFNNVWSNHIDTFIDYTIGTAQGREGDRREARRRLAGFQQKLGAYLANVTRNKRGVATVSHELGMHDDLLMQQVDSYAGENYAAAHRDSYRAYQDMFSVASKLSALVAAKVAKVSPTGGVQTGGGGTALHHSR